VCGYVCRGQQGEIERIHPPTTNSKNRLKFFEVGYAIFRPSVFAAGKRMSVEILVGVGLHARCPVALTRLFKKRKCGRKIFIVFAAFSEQDIKSR